MSDDLGADLTDLKVDGLSSLTYNVDIIALLLTATFEVKIGTVSGSGPDLNTAVPASQLLKHIIAVQITSAQAKVEAKYFNAENGRLFKDAVSEAQAGDCYVCLVSYLLERSAKVM